MQEAAQIEQVLLARDKRGRDKIHAVADAEQKVVLVLLAEIDLMQDLIREAHALAVGKLAAHDDAAVHVRLREVLHLEDHKTVVHEHAVTYGQIMRQAGVIHADDRLVALDRARCKREGIAVMQLDMPRGKRADAVLWALRIEHDGDRQTKLLAHLLDHVDLGLMLGMGAVRKIQAGHIHARAAHIGKHGRVTAGRADGTDDLCFPHSDNPLSPHTAA